VRISGTDVRTFAIPVKTRRNKTYGSHKKNRRCNQRRFFLFPSIAPARGLEGCWP
jgi:hypothetical protein